MTGYLTPDGRLRVFSDLGVVLSGAKLYTYVGGTPSTPLASYSNQGLTVANTNPVVASAGGLFGPIYLTPNISYKLVLTDAAGVVIWSQDFISIAADSLAAGAGISLAVAAGVTTISVTGPTVATIGMNDFRLTLESGVPVSSTDQTAKTTLYCTPSGRGNRMDVYDAAGVPTTLTSAQILIAIPASVSQLYSVWAYNNAGVLTLELTPWTNDTTPGAAAYSISAVTGTWTKTGDLTRRFLGLVRTTTVNGQTEDSVLKRFVWNHYNRVRRPLNQADTVANYNYTTATWRQAHGDVAQQLELVVGVADALLDLTISAIASNTGANVQLGIGIGEDSTTVPLATVNGGPQITQVAAQLVPWSAHLAKTPAIGRHVYARLEWSTASGTTQWQTSANFAGNGAISAINGWIEG